MENDSENLPNKAGVDESQIVDSNSHGITNVKNTAEQTQLDSAKKCTQEKNKNSTVSDCSNESTLLLNEGEETIVNSGYEPKNQSVNQMESFTDNIQPNDLNESNKDINKNEDIQNNLNNLCEINTSGIDNENASSNETKFELIEKHGTENDTSCNNLNFNRTQTLSDNHQEDENSKTETINNYFGLVTELDSSSVSDNPISTAFVSSLADNSIVISNCNAVPQSDSIVSSNISLSQLRCYGSDESLSQEESIDMTTCYRDVNSKIDSSDKESDSDSSSTSSSSSIYISDSTDSESDCGIEQITAPKPIKAKGELDINDLPPIEDLTISVPEEDCTPVGMVFQIVDRLVVIQAIKDKPALNLDTVLFSQEGKPFGKIFDVFGPVVEPYYCVRFNSNDQIKEKNISLNQMVYCAPKTKYTNFVFLAQLLKCKGSDASWENDLEPPAEYLEYSDDEQEQRAKKALRKKAKKKQPLDADEPAIKKHASYERRMNKRNLQMSATNKSPRHQISNSLWNSGSASRDVASSSHSNVPHEIFGRPPVFSARIQNTPHFGSQPSRSMFPPTSTESNMFPTRHHMFDLSRNVFPPRPNMFPPRPDMLPPRPEMFEPRPNMLPPRPNMFEPRPDTLPPRTDIFEPRPNMLPPRPNIFTPRPDYPNTLPFDPNMTPPRHDRFSPGYDFRFPPRVSVMQPRPSTSVGENIPTHHPMNSFNSTPPRWTDSNPHQRMSPMAFNHNENNNTFSNPYPRMHHGNLSNCNWWVQNQQLHIEWPSSPQNNPHPPPY